MEFKDRIRIVRHERNMTQADLASAMGKSESAIRMWETDRSKPDCDTLIKLADYFNCSTDYLLGLSEYKTVQDKEDKEHTVHEAWEEFTRVIDYFYEMDKIHIINEFFLTVKNAQAYDNYLQFPHEFLAALNKLLGSMNLFSQARWVFAAEDESNPDMTSFNIRMKMLVSALQGIYRVCNDMESSIDRDLCELLPVAYAKYNSVINAAIERLSITTQPTEKGAVPDALE